MLPGMREVGMNAMHMEPRYVNGEHTWAFLSEDDVYRYELGRVWDADLPLALWIMLNPSTADAYVDDPTIRRVRSFTKREGLGGFVVINQFALRATNPDALLRHNNPTGPENMGVIGNWLARDKTDVGLVVAAWGAWVRQGPFRQYRIPIHQIKAYTDHEVMCLGTTKYGDPRHPLYVKSDTPFIPWRP